MVMEGDFAWGGEHTIQYTDDKLYSCIPETYRSFLGMSHGQNQRERLEAGEGGGFGWGGVEGWGEKADNCN